MTLEGGHSYPDTAGRPCLTPMEHQGADSEETPSAGPGWVSRVAGSLEALPWPSPDLNLVSARNYRALTAMLDQNHTADAPAQALVVGGGELGDGIGELLDSDRVEAVETDIYPGSRVQLLCDAHHLPFADRSFDVVVVQAVLEHVFDPPRVAAETHRVLAPQGLVYSEIPFMQQVHEGPYDITRYTELGHRRLFRMFDELDRGPVGGPGMALAWSFRYLARSLAPRGGTGAALLGRMATLLTFWLKYIDRLVLTHPGASDGASGTYFLGRRREEPIDDEALVASYRGAIPVPRR